MYHDCELGEGDSDVDGKCHRRRPRVGGSGCSEDGQGPNCDDGADRAVWAWPWDESVIILAAVVVIIEGRGCHDDYVGLRIEGRKHWLHKMEWLAAMQE